LGFVISHDALHYREPIPDFRLVPAFEEAGQLMGYGPSLAQGQGLCNWGDETMLWYELWNLGGVRLATWPRDRLGYLQMYRPEELNGASCDHTRHCITCPIRPESPSAHVYANVDCPSQYGELTVEVLDEQFRPLPGYSGDDCIPLRESGLRQLVKWKDRDAVNGLKDAFRLRVNWGGIRPEDPKLFALYVVEKG